MVDFLEINGQKHPVIVNFYVIGCFQQETGLSLSSLSEFENKLYLIEPLLWHALRIGYIVNKEQIPFGREEMPILLSDNGIYAKFTEIITKSFPTAVDTTSTKKKKT
jgi:hypothetical protein